MCHINEPNDQPNDVPHQLLILEPNTHTGSGPNSLFGTDQFTHLDVAEALGIPLIIQSIIFETYGVSYKIGASL